jgi:hypothetical protein
MLGSSSHFSEKRGKRVKSKDWLGIAMLKRLALATLILSMAACTPPATKKDDAPPAPEYPAASAPPPASLAAEPAFKDCAWSEVKGGGVALNAFQCPGATFEADDALPGIVRISKDADNNVLRSPVVQVFSKGSDRALESVLPAVRAASAGADTCTLIPAGNEPPKPGNPVVYKLYPTGKAKDEYERYVAGQLDAEKANLLPCGSLGPSEGGFVEFVTAPGAPDKMAAVSYPGDIPAFDGGSLRAAP